MHSTALVSYIMMAMVFLSTLERRHGGIGKQHTGPPDSQGSVAGVLALRGCANRALRDLAGGPAGGFPAPRPVRAGAGIFFAQWPVIVLEID